MKRFLSLLSFVVVSIVAFAQTYTITPQQFSLEVGGDGQQLVLLKDGSKYEGTVKWIAGSEESEKLIAVSDDGLVTAYAAGSAMVNAVVDDAIVATAYATISDKKPTSKYGFYTGENLMLVVGDRQWQCLFVYDEKGESTMYEGVVEWSIENEKTEVITLQDAETSNAIYMSADAIGSAKLSAKVDGEVVAELIVGVRDSYKLLPETYTLEASRDTIIYYVFNSQGDTVKPYSYELQCRWIDNQPHIEHSLTADGYGIMVWGTGYGNSEGSLYVSVEDRGNVYENVIYQLISSEYTGEIYAAEDVSLFLGGGSQKLVILDALGAEVTLPEGFYIDYDSSFVSIKNGQITPLKYGQQSLRIVGKSGVMSSFNVTITNEAGYVIDVWAGEKITEGDEIYIDLQKKEEGFEYLQSVENPTFVSSADSIVKCEGNMLLAVAPGDATITAVVDKEPVAEISITVVAKETMTYKISPSEKFELMVDDTQEFTLFAGDLKYEGDIEWIVTAVSDNPVETGKELAKFNGNILYAYEPGIVQVFAVIPAVEGDKQTIQGPQVEILKAKDYRFAFEQEQYTMMAGEQATASLIFGDDIDLSLATVEVFPSNDSLSASIGQNKNIVVLYSDYAGEYTVTALCRYGDQKFETDVTVIVNKKVEYFLQDSLFSLAVGDSKELILYKNDVPYEGDIEWNVFEEEPGSTPCAEISNDTLYALQAGTCTIEAKVDGNIVAKASVVVTSFSGKFFVSDTVFCDGSEGTIFIACSESYNTEFLSIQSADGRLIDFEIDKDTAYVDYANLDNGLYIISYAGMQVATFEVVVNELPEIEIVPTVDSYVVGTEYQFGVQLFGDSEPTESVVYRWEVIDDSNPDSRDNMDYKHENTSLLVTFFAEGDYTINCEPLDKELGCQGKMVSTQVTVGKKVTYQIGEGKYLLNVGETKQLILYANGEEYTGDDVEWNILGDGTTEEVIAEVSDGVLSALAEGTCTIEAKLGGTVVATAALTVSKFLGVFMAADTVFCQGSEGKVTITCTEEYNTDLVSVMTATGAPVDIEFDESTMIIDYTNLTSGVYAVSYAGMQVATFEVVVNELPEIEIVPTVDSYVVGTEYQFGVQLFGDSESTESVVYRWEVIDESNPDSRDNMDYKHENSSLLVTFFAEGDYTINCEPLDKELGCQGKMVSTQVTVGKKVTYQIGDGKYLLNVDETKQLILYANGEEYSGDDVEWNILSDGTTTSTIAEISDGIVTALAEGTCTIEAKLGGNVVATAPLTIVQQEIVTYQFETDNFNMMVGETKELILYKNGEVYEGIVEWKVLDADGMVLAEVDEYGYLHANYEGSTTIYAIIDTVVAQASLTIEYTGGNSKSIGFTEPGYSVTEGGTTGMCLELYGFDSGFTIDYELSLEDIASCEFYYESNCFKLEGLSAGRAMLYVTLLDGEDKYTASAAISVNEKPIVHFNEEEYFMSIGDEVTASLVFEKDIMLPEDDKMQVEFENENLFEILKMDKYSVTFKALQTGLSSITASIYDGNYTATSSVFVGEKIIVPEDTLPAPTCDYENNTYTVCTSYAAEFPNGIPMDRMVYSEMEMENEDIVYQWYNAAGEPLENTPVIYPTQVGSFTYYVSQKMKDGVDMVNGVIYYESEKTPLTLNVTYVPTPTINMYDQKICNGEEIKPFKVNIPDKTEAYWYDENWNEVATGVEFVPTNIALGKRVYTVIVRDTNWCESKELQVSLINGFVEKPAVTLLSDKNEFAPNEAISFVAKPAGDNIGIIWSANNENTTGYEFKTKFSEIGEYEIICKAVDQETGCFASDTQKVVVKEVIIPVEAIEIVQKDFDLYVGESALIEYSVIPEHATNKNVNVRCTSTGSTDAAVVRGMRINAVADGTEMIVISSDANPEVTAECFVRVHKKVKGENIVMPSLITLEVGSETSFNVVVTPSDATYNTVYFKEKEDDIISISSDGIIRAKSAGTSTISAYTADGLYATATVYVTEETKTITTINVPSEVVLKKGESMAISYSIEPVSLAIKEIAWAMADEGIASFEDGIIKANNVGETTLTASVAGISKSIKITVNNSNAPVLNLPTVVDAPVSVTNDKELKSISLGQASIDLSEFISDDSTAFENLKIAVTTNPADLGVANSGPIYVIDGKGMEGPATINLSVTDIDGLTTAGSFVVNFVKVVNEAPEILVDTLVVKYGIPSYFDFAALAQDDFTSTSLLEFTFGSAEGIESKIVDKRLVVTADYGSKEFSSIDMKVVDAYGAAASKTIVVNVASMPNKAPVIAVVPNQLENDTIPFGTFNLNDYVTDDYTAPSDIVWTVTSSENIAVRISNGVAVVKVLNEFWNGAEVITFTATDEDGLSSSVDVYYIRNISQVTYEQQKIETNAVAPVWEGAPTVSIMTMRQIGVPNQEFVLMANISSFDCTWEWIIDGADGIDQTSMLQSVTFKNPGLYTVKMKVMSADGEHVVEAELPVQLTVVGIGNHDIAICQGDAVELNAIGDVNSLLWSTDEISSSIFVRPSTTTKYTLTMKKGMFTMTDEVTVNVSVPVSLMEDSVMCAGTEFALEAQGEFESYSWNTGATSKSITIPAELASYIVYATDANNCMSVDTFNITKVNELPILDIAKDAELNPCDGTEVILNAGVGYAEYAWTITKGAKTENQTAVETITVDTTTIVAATVVDENGCIGQQEVTVNFKYPYAEQLGVATFSETTDHIILAWEKTMDVNTVKYRIERETHETDNWEQVGEDVMFDEPGLIVDEDVNYKQRAYKYRLVTTDVCNNEAISEVHRSMIATYQNQDNGLKTIQWCAYEPMSMITQYLVLRGTDVTAMDTVDKVPASNLYEIWNEVDPQFKNVKDIKYRVVFRLKEEVDENKYNTLASIGSGKGTKEYDEQMLKAESGPFALALSNIAEAENTTDIDVVPFADVVVYPTAITSVINVAIASNEEKDFEIEVVNTNGQSMSKVHTGAISKAIIQIPAEGFAQGMYSVKISDGTQTKAFKVTK